jgi:hypothetical protein
LHVVANAVPPQTTATDTSADNVPLLRLTVYDVTGNPVVIVGAAHVSTMALVVWDKLLRPPTAGGHDDTDSGSLRLPSPASLTALTTYVSFAPPVRPDITANRCVVLITARDAGSNVSTTIASSDGDRK